MLVDSKPSVSSLNKNSHTVVGFGIFFISSTILMKTWFKMFLIIDLTLGYIQGWPKGNTLLS